MSSWLSALTEARLDPLVFALLHTVWVGGIAAGVLAGVLRFLPASRASLRYTAAVFAQWAIVFAALVMGVCLDRAVDRAPAADPLLRAAAQGEEPTVAAADSSDDLHLAVKEFAGTNAAATSNSGPPSPPPGVPIHEHWTRYLAAFWLAGVILMLLRMAMAVADAGRFVRSGHTAQLSTIELVDRLRREMGIARRVRVVSSRLCNCPAVAGVVWPTLVLPVSLLTELSPEALRAILLHELAHIRRHDYLLNLVQMLIEAVLFFNPAVWWISRQIRIEREACCDAWAVQFTGDPIEYSRALAQWAALQQRSSDREGVPVAALAIGGRRRPPLLSRVRRVLLPGERPGVHLSPFSLLGFLAMALLAVGALWQGANLAVAVAAEILTAAERVEQVSEKVEAFSPPGRSEGEGPVTLRGTIRAEDGQPLPKHVRASSHTRNEKGSIHSTEGEFGETFEITVRPGVIWLHLQADGYAPGVAGPFNGAAGAVIDDIEVVLPKGFTAEFVVTDEVGNPVSGADISAGYILGSGSMNSMRAQTDPLGRGVFPHAIAGEYHVSAKAPGYQDLETTRMDIEQGEPLSITLQTAFPVTGQVLTADGRPVSGAEIQKFVTRGPGVGNRIHGPIGNRLATTDGEGHFTMDQLVSGRIYDVLVKHPEHGTRVHEGIEPGQKDLQLTLGPSFTLEGILRGDLSNLPQRRGKPFVKVRQEVPVGTEGVRGWYGDEGIVEPTDTGGRFVISGLLPAKTTLTAGEHRVVIDLTEPRQQVTIDLTKPAPTNETQAVELVFEADKDAPPRGSVELFVTHPSGGILPENQTVSLRDGVARFDVAVGANVRVWPDGLIGYWFESPSFSVDAGEDPQRVPIDTIAAGAVSGLVLLPDGSPAADASITVRAVEKPEALKLQSITPSTGQQLDARGRFVITPLPLDATYVIAAAKRYNQAVSEPVALTAAAPTTEVKLVFAPEASAAGVVLGPDGRPLANIPLQLQFNHPRASNTWNTSFPTDRNGRFEVDGLSSTVGNYQVRLDTNKDYQPQVVQLNPGGPAVTMQLEAGHVLEGRVVDAATGKPIPGVELYAHPVDYQPDQPFAYEAESKTAIDGSFRFSNLALQPYQINDRDGLMWDKETVNGILPGPGKELLIEGTLPEWSRLQVAD